jgi:hypothetical protein
VSINHEQAIAAPILAATTALAQRYQPAQPFWHVVMDDFFNREWCQRPVDGFPLC